MEKLFDINERSLSVRCKLFYEKDLYAIKDIVIILHGFGSSKDIKSSTKFSERLISKYKNFAVIAFDLPCHGLDARKKLSVYECLEYLELVIKYSKEKLNAERIHAYAISFGGYLVLKYLSEHNNPFNKMVLRSLPVNIYCTFCKFFSEDESYNIQKGKYVIWGFERKMKISKEFFDELAQDDISQNKYLDFSDEILIIHGTEDQIVALGEVKEFSDKNVLELITVDRADHSFSNPILMDLAIKKAVEFIGERVI